MTDNIPAPNPYYGLPVSVWNVMASALFTEFATVTREGVPLDTPTYCFTGTDGLSIDVATGVAYPTKAERARRNAKVGLLLEGSSGAPVVSISAIAAVRDADIQANANRYIAETIAYESVRAQDLPWSVRRNAIWYWSRIFVLCFPKQILWWPNAATTDLAPQRWDAPADFTYLMSDPAPASAPTPPPKWPTRVWRERGQELLAQGIQPHATLTSDIGFPLPFRCRSATMVEDGFVLDIPRGAPWQMRGKASLCFAGLATFIGHVTSGQHGTHFVVHRMTPDLPMVQNPKEVFEPSTGTRAVLMDRLEKELARRGQMVPHVFEHPPRPTSGSLVRAAFLARMTEEMLLRNKSSD